MASYTTYYYVEFMYSLKILPYLMSGYLHLEIKQYASALVHHYFAIVVVNIYFKLLFIILHVISSAIAVTIHTVHCDRMLVNSNYNRM